MKFTSVTSLALLSAAVTASPIEYGPPPGGWGSVNYPPGTGANLPSYPAPPGGWANVNYPPGTGSGSGSGSAPAPAPAQQVLTFTSTYFVTAKGDQVINGTTKTPGPANAVGYFNYGINSAIDLICYNITLLNVVGAYQSPARTATHIHEGAFGASGPPRIAFPNPVGDDKFRRSVGCLQGPFTTGVVMNGADTGTGFTVAQIERNPKAFFTDSHTALFVPGVVRGQLG